MHNAGKPWGYPDRDLLITMSRKGDTTALMASTLGRSEHAIKCKLESLNLPTQINVEEKKIMKNNAVSIKIFVGEREASKLGVEELIDIIDQEETFIKRLKPLAGKSTAIAKLLIKHESNITELIALIGE